MIHRIVSPSTGTQAPLENRRTCLLVSLKTLSVVSGGFQAPSPREAIMLCPNGCQEGQEDIWELAATKPRRRWGVRNIFFKKDDKKHSLHLIFKTIAKNRRWPRGLCCQPKIKFIDSPQARLVDKITQESCHIQQFTTFHISAWNRLGSPRF